MDSQWVVDFYSQEHWDLVLLEGIYANDTR